MEGSGGLRLQGWGGMAEGAGPGDPVTIGVMGPGAPELGLASRSLDGRAVGRVLQIFVLHVRGEGWREEGRGGDRKSV